MEESQASPNARQSGEEIEDMLGVVHVGLGSDVQSKKGEDIMSSGIPFETQKKMNLQKSPKKNYQTLPKSPSKIK